MVSYQDGQSFLCFGISSYFKTVEHLRLFEDQTFLNAFLSSILIGVSSAQIDCRTLEFMINQKAEIAQKRKENETDTEKGKNCWKTNIAFCGH